MKNPRRTVRMRFTLLYGAMFLLSGVALLAIANLVGLGGERVSQSVPAGPVTTPAEHVTLLRAELADAETAWTRQVLAGSAVALGVMVVVSFGLGRVVAGRVLRPLRTITAATRRISADNLHERLSAPGPADEVKDLADTIDELLERLEGSFAAQRRFVADASHELRTPLATMRASLGVAMAKPEPVPPQTAALAGRLRTELDQVDRLLEGLLLLARAQHGALSERATLSLGDLLTASLDAHAAGVAAKDLTVTADVGAGADDGNAWTRENGHGADDGNAWTRENGHGAGGGDVWTRGNGHGAGGGDVWTRGNGTLLARMIDNVVGNAVTHNVRGGWIRAAVAADGPVARLVVETGGPVLDQAQVDRLAQPFQRLGADRTGSEAGSGLGLSIVAAIATAHGGTLDLRARPGGGLTVTVALPLAAVEVAA